MQVLNLKSYTPEFSETDEKYNEAIATAIQAGVIWYKTDTGEDFYAVRNTWTDKTLWKLAYGLDGRVFSKSKDIFQVIVHEGTSIIEVAELPENFDSHFFWFVKDGKLVEDVEQAQTVIRHRLLGELDASISVLQNRVDDGDATDEHVAKLRQQRATRVALRKLDMKVKINEWPSV